MLYIHIGSQKTGSTAIQGFLYNNRQALKQAGFNYVRSGRKKSAHNGMNFLFKRGNAQTVCDDIVAEIEASPVDNHIISSELFFREGVALGLREHFPERIIKQTKIICYLRRQDKYIESVYKQSVKNGRIPPNSQKFLARKQNNLVYSKALSAFSKVFGQNNIIVQAFERSNFPEGDIIKDFAQAIGLSLTHKFKFPSEISNKSLSVQVSEILGVVNKCTNFNSRVIIREIIRLNPDGAMYSDDVFDLEVRRELLKQCAPDIELVRATYCPEKEKLFNLDDLALNKPDLYPDPETQLLRTKQAINAVFQAIGNIESAKIAPPE